MTTKTNRFELCKIILWGITLFLIISINAHAISNPNERLSDPALEARAHEISSQVRCPVCESQSINDSNAEVSRDLRILIRERLVAGDSNEEIFEFLRARYGDVILLNPPLNTRTGFLWLGPFIILGFGSLAAFTFIRKANQ